MCQVLGVSRSGYYEWVIKKPSKRRKETEKITSIMRTSYAKAQGMIGLDKIWEDVRDAGHRCGRNRVYKLQKANQLYSVRKKPFRHCITDSNHSLPKAPNILNQEFKVDRPNAVWVTDITEFKTAGGKLYLATIKDLFHKGIVGWALANHMRTELCIDALSSAIKQYRPPKGLIHHSDQGSQYCSYEYVNALETYGIVRSMSRRGNCWDNACAETFFSTIKSERLYHRTYKNIEEARNDIFWYIECFYNRQRRHASLGYMRPVDYLSQYYKSIREAA